MLNLDYIKDGVGYGEVGTMLERTGFDVGLMRPYIENGEKFVNVHTGDVETIKNADGHPIYNHLGEAKTRPVLVKTPVRMLQLDRGINLPIWNASSLRKDEWIRLDTVLLRVARQRLRAWGDLVSANPFGGFNAMATMTVEHEVISDPGEAQVDMNGISEGRRSAPRYKRRSLPLPITHSDFSFDNRTLLVSRTLGTPLDFSQGESASRRVSESVEKTTIGVQTGVTYGGNSEHDSALGSTVYGYTNYPYRITKADMTAPTGSNGTTVLTSWLALRDELYDNNFFGPFMVYTSNDYDQYLDNLFSTTEPSAGTLRSRLLQIDGITGIRRLDYLTNTFTVLMIQMGGEHSPRAINGLGITTLQWESKGGMEINFKVMAIQVPQMRADYDGRCGIAHGTTA